MKKSWLGSILLLYLALNYTHGWGDHIFYNGSCDSKRDTVNHPGGPPQTLTWPHYNMGIISFLWLLGHFFEPLQKESKKTPTPLPNLSQGLHPPQFDSCILGILSTSGLSQNIQFAFHIHPFFLCVCPRCISLYNNQIV